VGARAGRIVRIIRLIRLIRIVKLYKASQANTKQYGIMDDVSDSAPSKKGKLDSRFNTEENMSNKDQQLQFEEQRSRKASIDIHTSQNLSNQVPQTSNRDGHDPRSSIRSRDGNSQRDGTDKDESSRNASLASFEEKKTPEPKKKIDNNNSSVIEVAIETKI